MSAPSRALTDDPYPLKRGGPQYQLGLPGFLVNEFAGFALGVDRRAQDVIICNWRIPT
ncbi:MAG: hypothetical protein HYX63_16185 [Gammaproteobacteria bacterium]|nr:hypothetical protein [Gammaproteobacteria bacterium]